MPRTFDQGGQELHGFSDEPTADPYIRKAEVPHGTQPPAYVTAVSAQFPNAETDTWYYPTQHAYDMGRIGAALQTLEETAENVGGAIVTGVENISKFSPLIIGAAVLFVLWQASRR